MNFENDLRNIILKHLKASGASFDPSSDVKHLMLALFTVQERRISSSPRITRRTPEFTAAVKKLPASQRMAAAEIERKIQAGEDVNMHLSKGSLTPARDDDLLLEWGISHFHLSLAKSSGAKDPFLARTGPLAFAHITASDAYFLNVCPHGNFTEPTLLDLMIRRFPDLANAYEMKGVVGLSQPGVYSAEQIKKFRSVHLNVPYEVDGRFFFAPGSGFVASGHSAKAAMRMNQLLKQVKWLEEVTRANESTIIAKLAENFGHPVDPTKLAFELAEANGEFMVKETETGQYARFNFPNKLPTPKKKAP